MQFESVAMLDITPPQNAASVFPGRQLSDVEHFSKSGLGVGTIGISAGVLHQFCIGQGGFSFCCKFTVFMELNLLILNIYMTSRLIVMKLERFMQTTVAGSVPPLSHCERERRFAHKKERDRR